jgi:hypothetical protein
VNRGGLSRRRVVAMLSAVSVGGAADVDPSIRFAGRDWAVKTSRGRVGPGPNYFDAANVTVTPDGALLLRISHRSQRWSCAEIICSESLGYGVYRFEVSNTSRLDVNAVLGLFTWDTQAADAHYREIDVEISRWGDPRNENGQFVVQPYTKPRNIARFAVPAGPVIYQFVWAAGSLACSAAQGGRVFQEHGFTAGVPEPGSEQVRMNLWLFRGNPPAHGKDVEVRVDSFSFASV